MDVGKDRGHRLGVLLVLVELDQRFGEGFGGRRVLKDLRHHEAPGENVGQANVGRLDQTLADPPGRRRHLVGDDHWPLDQRRFERRRSARHQRDVGRTQGILGMPEQQAERHVVGLLRMNRLFEPQASLTRGQRHDELRIGEETLTDEPGGLHEGVGHLFQLSPAAPGQQRENGQVARQRQLVPHRSLARFQWNDVGQRMPDKGHRNIFLLVERRFHREERQQAVDGAPDLLDPPAAPGPDRWTDVMDVLDPGIVEFHFEAEIEAGRADADEDIGTCLEESLLQLAPDAGDLAIILQGIDIAHDR